MKKTILILSAIPLFYLLSAFSPARDNQEVKIYLENKCAETIEFKAQWPGKTERHSLAAGEKKMYSFQAGTKIFVFGEEIVEFSTDKAGETYPVCK